MRVVMPRTPLPELTFSEPKADAEIAMTPNPFIQEALDLCKPKGGDSKMKGKGKGGKKKC